MGFSVDVSVPLLTVFVQGLLSFFSPCVFPLIPLYMGYLSGGTAGTDETGQIIYRRGRVLVNTLFFVLGISFAFFLLGLGMSALGRFFAQNQLLLARIGGVVVFAFGLYQLGFFGTSSWLGRERRLPLKLRQAAMSPWLALALGFTFSFAWTPCVGPVLASVLLMSASAATSAAGLGLIGVYTLGFVLPFLAVGLFTTTLLGLFRRHRGVVKYTLKLGGLLLMVMGVMMFTGKMNAVTGYLSQISQPADLAPAEDEPQDEPLDETLPLAPDFTLTDQYGDSHTLSDYRGKTVFLNFWATWCPPCRREMPDIQALYEGAPSEGDDALVVLGVAAPGYGSEATQQEIADFLRANGYTYPVLMDDGSQVAAYGVNAYPTTFMIDREGRIFGYVSGQISGEMMDSIVRQTMEGVRE